MTGFAAALNPDATVTLPRLAVYAAISLMGLAALPGTLLAADYFPGPANNWERRAPSDVGLNVERLQEAIQYSKENETRFPEELNGVANVRDLEIKIALDIANEPYSTPIGPIKPRGDLTGVILRNGYIVAEWGQPARVDMTFSISKTFLSTVAGLAWDRKMIDDVHDRAHDYVPGDLFSTPHNRLVTWDQLLRQTSNWRGVLWGKPDWADRPGDEPWEDLAAPPRRPGTAWEYNDVRVNVLALALLHVWRQPLPEVLDRHVMKPINASSTWQWHGYDESWVLIDGQQIQSVSGGGHWGGGMWISAYDLARFGYLYLRDGEWDGNRIISSEWIDLARTPTAQRPDYGFMNFFLNDGGPSLPDNAPASAYAFRGSGANVVYVDEENDIVAVIRWIDRDAVPGFIERVLNSIE